MARPSSAAQAGPAGAAQQAQAENFLTGALRQLFALVENYPDLKANQNVLQLQEELTTTENQIGFSRQHYNSTVREFNTSIQTFPNVLIAGHVRLPRARLLPDRGGGRRGAGGEPAHHRAAAGRSTSCAAARLASACRPAIGLIPAADAARKPP